MATSHSFGIREAILRLRPRGSIAKLAACKRNKASLPQTREKIKVGHILRRLGDHVDGKVNLSPAQVRAAEILLKKVLPDLSSVSTQVDGDLTVEIVKL